MPPSHYRHRAVRDLAWACFSRPLILSAGVAPSGTHLGNAGFELDERREAWLAALDEAPGRLLEFLADSPTRRLGVYFERLWHFFLGEDPEVTLLAHNLPVRDAGRTIGEFDCIYYCHRRQCHCHLELAVKFYLAHGIPDTCRESGWQHWLGPNSADRLDIKLQRLLQHQTRLSSTGAGARELAALGVQEVEREMEVKGYLYAPGRTGAAAPRGFNPQRLPGQWWRRAEFAAQADPALRYAVVPRLKWLAPLAADDGLDHLPIDDLLASPALLGGQARLVAGVDATGNERSRAFVLDAGWPGKMAH